MSVWKKPGKMAPSRSTRLAESDSPTSADTPMTDANENELPPDRVAVDRADESMAVGLLLEMPDLDHLGPLTLPSSSCA